METEMTNENNGSSMGRHRYTHRVGSITAGLCMVGFGILFLLNTVFDRIGYEMIFSMWPLILICLGLELFLTNFEQRKIVYDKAAVFLLIVMAFFAIMMAFVDTCMEHFPYWCR